MLSSSEQCVLHHHYLHDERLPLSSHHLLRRPHQLKLSLRDDLQDVYNRKLIQRWPIAEPLCQFVIRVKDVNQSSSSYEKLLRTWTYSEYKVAFGTNILHNIADAVWDIQGQSTLEQPRSNARIVASLDSDDGKAEGARKALEQAFQGKKNIAKKWEEEIRKRELSGGDGGSGAGSGGGGGGGGDDEEMGESFGQDEPWDWEEAGQTFMATFALMILYISITHGPKQVIKKFKLLFRFIRQGFRLRKIPDEYLRPEGPEDDSDEDYEGDSDVDDDDVDARDDFIRNRQAELSTSKAQDGDVQKNDSVNDETEDEDDDDVPTPPKQQLKRENLLSKRQAEQKEKLLQLLTPKERRQQEERK